MPDYAELLKRVQDVKGADREVNEKLALIAGWHQVGERLSDGKTIQCWYDPDGVEQFVPRYTASIDAAVGLVEKMLPSAGVTIGVDRDRKVYASVRWGDGVKDVALANAPSPALALLAALLQALIQKEET